VAACLLETGLRGVRGAGDLDPGLERQQPAQVAKCARAVVDDDDPDSIRVVMVAGDAPLASPGLISY